MKGVKVKESSLEIEAFVEAAIENTAQPGVSGKPLVEISSDDGFCSISVSKYRMNKEVSFGKRLLQLLEDFGLHYEHVPTGIDDLMLVLQEKQLGQEVEGELLERIKTELSVDKVTIKRDLSLVMVVGGKIDHNIDSISRAANALAEEKINIEMIHMNHGPSQLSLVFGVKAHDEKRAVAALYHEFFASVSV